MEERRDGSRRTVRVVSNPTGTLVVRFPFASALVHSAQPDERTALLLGRLISTGCKVGLASADRDAARRIAKARGAMYVPGDDAEAARAMFSAIVSAPDVEFYESEDGIRVRMSE